MITLGPKGANSWLTPPPAENPAVPPKPEPVRLPPVVPVPEFANDVKPPPGALVVPRPDVLVRLLPKLLPAVPPVLGPSADVVALVKPQFEAGRDEVGAGGLVRDPEVHARVVADVTAAAAGIGLMAVGMTPSPVTGASGNQEFLLHLRERA